MFAKVINWRLGEAYREPEAYKKFLKDLSAHNIPLLRRYGLLDGFILRTAEDTIMSVNFYDTEAQAELAWTEVVSREDYGTDGKLELIDRKVARADDLPLLLDD